MKKILIFILLATLSLTFYNQLDKHEVKALVPMSYFHHTSCYEDVYFQVTTNGVSTNTRKDEIYQQMNYDAVKTDDTLCLNSTYEHIYDFVIDREVSGSIQLDNISNQTNYDMSIFQIREDEITEIQTATNPYTYATENLSFTNLAPGHYYLYIYGNGEDLDPTNSLDFRLTFNLSSTGNQELWASYNSTSDIPSDTYSNFMSNSDIDYEDMVINYPYRGGQKYTQVIEYSNKKVMDKIGVYYDTVIGIMVFEDISGVYTGHSGSYFPYSNDAYVTDKRTKVYFARVRIRHSLSKMYGTIDQNFVVNDNADAGTVLMELLDNDVFIYDWNRNTLTYESTSYKDDLTLRNIDMMVRVDDHNSDPTDDNTFKRVTINTEFYNENSDVTVRPDYYADALAENLNSIGEKGLEHVITKIPVASEIYSWYKTAKEFTDPWINAYTQQQLDDLELELYDKADNTDNFMTFGTNTNGNTEASRIVGTFMTSTDNGGLLLEPHTKSYANRDYIEMMYETHNKEAGTDGSNPTYYYTSIIGDVVANGYSLPLFDFEYDDNHYFKSVYKSGEFDYYRSYVDLDQDMDMIVEVDHNPDATPYKIHILKQNGFDSDGNPLYFIESSSTSRIDSYTFQENNAYFVYVEYLSDTKTEEVNGELNFIERPQNLSQPTITTVSTSENSITVKYKNNNTYPLELYADINDTTPQTYLGTLAPGQEITQTYNGLNLGTKYKFYAKFVHEPSDITTSTRSYTIATKGLPSISTVDVGDSYIRLRFYNNSTQALKVYAEHTDSSPDVYIGTIQPGSYLYKTFSGLRGGRYYTFYVKFNNQTTGQYSSVVSKTIKTGNNDIIIVGW